MARDGVLILAFGGPDSLEAVRDFMCRLMNREPSDELVARVTKRYEAIGGSSPLPAIAGTIAQALEERLAAESHDVPVRVGMAYSAPFVAEALDELRALGVQRVIGVSLSAFESKAASGACRDAVEDARGELEYAELGALHELPAFVDAHAEALTRALGEASGEKALVVFTAHSLPESDIVDDDAYVVGLRRTADEIVARFDWAAGAEGEALAGAYGSMHAPQPWLVAYQSKGQRPGAWLGPEIENVIDAASEAGFESFVVSPIGFLTDHMETLYDLDIVAAKRAAGAGIEFARAAVPNADSKVVAALAQEVESLIE